MEPCVDWIKRATHNAAHLAKKFQVKDCVEVQRSRKWNFVEKIALQTSQYWSKQALLWKPSTQTRFACRQQKRPKLRWEEDLVKFLKERIDVDSDDWLQVAKDKVFWKSLQEDYISGARHQELAVR